METCYFSIQPGIHRPTPEPMTPPPEDLGCSDPQTLVLSQPEVQLPKGGPDTPESLPSSLHEKPPQIQITIPLNQGSRPRNLRRSSSSLSSSDQMFSARSRQEILAESAYLEFNLQAQCLKKLNVYRDYASTEAQLQTVETAKQRRSLRKHLSALRSQYYSIMNQEKALETRLSDLRIELRNNCAWGLARSESCCPSPVWSPPRPDTPLDATSPEFVPRRRFFGDLRENGSLERVDETGEESCAPENQTQLDEGVALGSEPDESSMGQESNTLDTEEEIEEPFRRRSLDEETPSLKERRLSLPYIPSEWI